MTTIKIRIRVAIAAMTVGVVMAGAAALACARIDSTAGTGAQETSALVGDWRGESICQVKDSPCHDERVVYHVSKSRDSGKVTISADKIVEGNAINMGVSDWDYDQEHATLSWRTPRGDLWKLNIKSGSMEGTLTLADGALYRRLSLKKD